MNIKFGINARLLGAFWVTFGVIVRGEKAGKNAAVLDYIVMLRRKNSAVTLEKMAPV